MTIFKKISLLILPLALCMLMLVFFTACSGDDYEGGVLYDGTTVIGADKEATSLVIRDGTTVISDYAFAGCKNLESLTIPASVNQIEVGAFDGCDKLIQTRNGVQYVGGWAVGADKKITEITVEDGTVGIAREAFARCESAKRATVADSVRNICVRSFFGCDSLEEITLPFAGFSADAAYNTHFGYIFGAFVTDRNSDYVPESLESVRLTSAKKLYQDAFAGCSRIKTVTLPNTLTEIGVRAFSECNALTGISIPDSVQKIEERAFYKCSALTTLKLPENDNFTSIHEYTFAYCSSLKAASVPVSVTNLGACSFARCTELEEVTLASPSLVRIGQQAFDGCRYLQAIEIKSGIIEKGAFQNCIELQTVTLGDNVTEIGEYAFNGCTGIKSFTMSPSVAKVGKYAFYACHSLTSLELPDSVTRIEDYTFYNCSRLADFNIKSSVTSVGANAFTGCTALAERSDSMTRVDGWIIYVVPATEILELDNTVRGFADGALDGCANLTEIIFNGTDTEWNKVKSTAPESKINSIKITVNP